MKQLNTLQMAALAAEGFSAVDIGDRLGFAANYVRKIARQHQILLCRRSVVSTLEDEHRRWRFYRAHGFTYSDIAWRFGRSRQAVYKVVASADHYPIHRQSYDQLIDDAVAHCIRAH